MNVKHQDLHRNSREITTAETDVPEISSCMSLHIPSMTTDDVLGYLRVSPPFHRGRYQPERGKGALTT